MSDIEEDRSLIAYCGLYCGDCFSHKEKVADLARDLRKTCEKLDFLKPGHGDAHMKNLRKIKKKGIGEFLEGKE
jgi:phytoene dehydrogenase-like protein